MTFRLMKIWCGWMICGFARDPAWPSRRQVQPVPLVHATKLAPTFFDEAICVRSNGPSVSTSEASLICAFFSIFCPYHYFIEVGEQQQDISAIVGPTVKAGRCRARPRKEILAQGFGLR